MRTVAAILVITIALFAFAAPARGQSALTPEQQEAVRQALGLPPGSTVTLEHTTTKDGGSLKIEEEATGEGASLRARGEKIASDFNAGAPGANLGTKGAATGGTTETSNDVKGSSNLWANPLLWVGVALILLATASLVVRPPTFPVAIPIKATLVVAGAGCAFLASALFPVATLFIVGGVALVVVGLYLYREFTTQTLGQQAAKGEKSHKALRSVAAGISDFKKLAQDPAFAQVPPEMWDRLKTFLSSHVEPEEEAVIDEIRRQDNLR